MKDSTLYGPDWSDLVPIENELGASPQSVLESACVGENHASEFAGTARKDRKQCRLESFGFEIVRTEHCSTRRWAPMLPDEFPDSFRDSFPA
jgi:hypothetical protein